jgi:hypothetical protein
MGAGGHFGSTIPGTTRDEIIETLMAVGGLRQRVLE